MNKFEKMIEVDAAKFANQINRGEGWIAENDLLLQFFSMFPDYDSAIFDQDEIEGILTDYLEENGIEVKEGYGPIEEEDL